MESKEAGPSLGGLKRYASRYRTIVSAAAGIAFFIFAAPVKTSLIYGLPLILAGELLRVWSSGYILKNDRITREGPYSISRNPLYLGNFLIGAGFLVASGNLFLALFFLIFFFVLYGYTIAYEEQFLARKFPEEWSTYSAQVPRILGWRSLTRYVGGEFSWLLVASHREWRNIPVLVAAYLILTVKALAAGGSLG